jgi:molybdopterin-guanine dinucleotide biosynthesis protein A
VSPASGDLRAGLVLAGGDSTRFGRTDKAFATLDGRPLVGQVLERLDRVTDGLLVSCRDTQLPRLRRALADSGLSVAAVPDPVPDAGPAAGVAAGLAPCRAPYAAVVGCDTPLVDPELLAVLFERAGAGDGAVPRIDGRLRPTLAVYSTSAIRRACERSVESGDGSLRGALETLEPVVVSEPDIAGVTDTWCTIDVNTPADLDRARELYERYEATDRDA